ncbi:DEAD/DEAH box helicase family protein [Candidatus Chrysopegis kryptomonas]|uniref:Type III restriction enzyme, res subunit n=1 Tax=Candidatus Chryseopegocella kryptomonas TaxID=1633643 RepID=A0A0P1NVX9_9BACT|nr:DEAD/DEAH box helicase family protein [Candidatus Chrysopegis kryptomonas]CUT03325.1 Type III restriction enzyme, res subunit [Candidatus Chrysopegis kryptomonas]
MSRIFLQNMLEGIKFENLPSNWTSFDLEKFSRNKKLWDFQQEAIENAIKVLWKYFEDFVDYQDGEKLETNKKRKEKFFEWYKSNGLYEDLYITLDKKGRKKEHNLLRDYYPQENSKIPYKHFINRMSFWMATGSGKSLVIIKLIHILAELIERKEIPPYDILFLTHRDDLIDQLKKHVDEFNSSNEPKIILKELKEYPEVKKEPSLSGITVFYYRSDNLSDEQKEKIIDFKNYDNNGKWYIFLDEAHKGDKEESKRQHIYSILSRNGFLFNFSATFTDPRDIITCAFEFNLSSFIKSGYGKHIHVLKQEIRAFRDDEDYTSEEKQKIVLKSLILLTYVKKFYKKITKNKSDLYHNPLLLVLVNSVNIEDADLKLFFDELVKIGKKKIGGNVYKEARDELWKELKEEPEFIFEDGEKIKIEEKIFKSIKINDILNYVYNSQTSGEIEVIRNRSNNKELAFKLKTSDKPFALIKIGDISGWLKEKLVGYEVQERFEEESFFENLNKEDSTINILMGSRGFYEGWDSNRPNVINFINIGMGEDARKFILQSVGRGVRIEPVKGKRKRLIHLYNAKEIAKNLFNNIKDKVLPLETLFIFGTNKNALNIVIGELEQEKKKEGEIQISLIKNPAIEKNKKYKLLIPVYKIANYPLFKNRKQVKFEICKEDFEMLKKFIEFIEDDRILLMRYNTEPEKIKILKESLRTKNIFKFSEKSFKNVDLLIQRFFDHLSFASEEFEKFKELEDEIKHFKNIKVYFKDVNELQRKIETVSQSDKQERELKEKYKKGKITLDEYTEEIKRITLMIREGEVEYQGKRLRIKHIATHYYLPLILSEDEKIDYIKHIIKTKSEVEFINDLDDYLSENDNKFKMFDWWMFSKLDESLDEIYIPYYNPNLNKISRFYPDFIFWLKKGRNYFIVFVDPKGTEHVDYQRKIDGYNTIFRKNKKTKNSLQVTVHLFFRTKDINKIPKEYQKFWFDQIEMMLSKLLNHPQ